MALQVIHRSRVAWAYVEGEGGELLSAKPYGQNPKEECIASCRRKKNYVVINLSFLEV